MPKSRTSHRKRRSLEEIRVLMDRLDGSGMPVAQFATRIGVSVPTVYQWRHRLREAGAEGAPTMVRIVPLAGLASVSPVSAATHDGGIAIILPGGLVCRVDPGFHGETLLRLVEILAN
jgi:DNA-binding transcriptional regulator YiaG